MMAVWAVAFAIWFVIHPMNPSNSPQETQQQIQKVIALPYVLIPILVLISVGNAGIAVTGGFLSPLKPRRRLALRPGREGWGTIALLAIGTLAAGAVASSIVQLAGIHANQGANQMFSDMIHQSSPAVFAVLIFVLSVLPPVCEELLFRGYSQTRLVARWGPALGIGLSGLMFGLIHMDPVQTPDMIMVGSYFGWTAYRTGSTRTSIFCHLVNNAVAVLGSLGSKPDEVDSTHTLLITLAVGAVVCAICTWAANRLIPKVK